MTHEDRQSVLADIFEDQICMVYSVCLRDLRDPNLVQNAVRSVFCVLKKNWKTSDCRKYSSYRLYHITRVVCRNIRKQHIKGMTLSGFTSMPGDLRIFADSSNKQIGLHIADGAQWDHLEPHIHTALDRLNNKELEAFLLYFFQGCSFNEIAGVLSMDEKAVEVLFEDTLIKVWKRLSKRALVSSVCQLRLICESHLPLTVPCNVEASGRELLSDTKYIPATAMNTKIQIAMKLKYHTTLRFISVMSGVIFSLIAASQIYAVTNPLFYTGQGGVLLRYHMKPGDKYTYRVRETVIRNNNGRQTDSHKYYVTTDYVADDMNKDAYRVLTTNFSKTPGYLLSDYSCDVKHASKKPKISLITNQGESRLILNDMWAVFAQCRYQLPKAVVKPGYSWESNCNSEIVSNTHYKLIDIETIKKRKVAIIEADHQVSQWIFDSSFKKETGHYRIYFDIDKGAVVLCFQYIKKVLTDDTTLESYKFIDLISHSASDRDLARGSGAKSRVPVQQNSIKGV